MNELISIIIPVFNIEKYIERCIKSVLVQTYSLLEVIIVDDGSTDNTAAIIDFIAEQDNRVKVIHKQNSGVLDARMEGILRAEGEWIGFVDGDDFIEPDMFERLLQNALTYHADISHCGYKMIFPGGHIDYYYNTGCVEAQDRITALRELLSGIRIEPSIWNKLFHKRLFYSLQHVKKISENIEINEDLLMNYWLFKDADVFVYEDFCPYHYILRRGSAATSRKKNHITDPLIVMNIIKNDLQGDRLLYPIAYSRYMRILIGVSTQKMWKEEERKAHKKLKEEIKRGALADCNSRKLQLMAFGTAYALPVYRVIRKIYDILTGVSKKYDI